jgi:hypothetical protein
MLSVVKVGRFGFHQATRAVAPICARTYHDNIIDHYENPRNVGSLDKNKKLVGTGRVTLFDIPYSHLSIIFRYNVGLVGAPACGDVMKLQFETDENGIIVDAKFKTFGCGSAIGEPSADICLLPSISNDWNLVTEQLHRQSPPSGSRGRRLRRSCRSKIPTLLPT